MFHPVFGGDAKRVLRGSQPTLWPSSSSNRTEKSSPPTRISAAVFGYELAEIKGQHHSLFVDPESRQRRRVQGILGQARPRRIRRRRIQADRQRRQGNLDSGVVQSDLGRSRQSSQSGRGRHRHHRRQIAGRGERRDGRRASRAFSPSSNSPPTATILNANENFPQVVGLCVGEDQGPASSHTRRPGLRPVRRISGILAQTEPRRT